MMAKVLSASQAFELHDTYGLPIEITRLECRRRGWTVDEEGFKRLMDQQRERSRADRRRKL